MQWRLGSRLPNKGLIRHQLAPFGQVSEDNIAIDHEKAVIEVQFGAAVEASGALIALNRKAETMFSVKQVGFGRAVAAASLVGGTLRGGARFEADKQLQIKVAGSVLSTRACSTSSKRVVERVRAWAHLTEVGCCAD